LITAGARPQTTFHDRGGNACALLLRGATTAGRCCCCCYWRRRRRVCVLSPRAHVCACVCSRPRARACVWCRRVRSRLRNVFEHFNLILIITIAVFRVHAAPATNIAATPGGTRPTDLKALELLSSTSSWPRRLHARVRDRKIAPFIRRATVPRVSVARAISDCDGPRSARKTIHIIVQ